jgi:cation transport ATPase
MWNDGILMKPQQSCETVGNITTICLNITGTLVCTDPDLRSSLY